MHTNTFHDAENAHNYLLANTYAHRYHMQSPGQRLGYVPDVNIRLTHWAGNRYDSLVDVEADLQRYPRRKLHDERSINDIRRGAPARAGPSSTVGEQWCEHTRVTTPLWTAKDALLAKARQRGVETQVSASRPLDPSASLFLLAPPLTRSRRDRPATWQARLEFENAEKAAKRKEMAKLYGAGPSDDGDVQIPDAPPTPKDP